MQETVSLQTPLQGQSSITLNSIQQNKPKNFNPPQVQFFEKKITKTQNKYDIPVLTKEICEVRSMFNKVDDAFKKRKESCMRMLWEISDLQGQLDYLEQNTKNYAETTAAVGASLSWTNNTFVESNSEFALLQQTIFAETQNCKSFYHNILKDGNVMLNALNEDLDRYKVNSAYILTKTCKLLENCDELEKSQLEYQNQIESSFYAFHEKRSIFKDNADSSKILSQELEKESKELIILEEEQKMLQNEIEAFTLRVDELSVNISDIDISLEEYIERIKKSELEFKNHFRSLEQENNRLSLLIDVKENELKALQSTFPGLISNYNHHSSLSEKLTKQIQDLIDNILEKERDIFLQEDIISCFHNTNFNNSISELISERDFLVDKIKKSALENERTYEITCFKLKELKFLHSEDSNMRYLIQNAKNDLTKKIEKAQDELHQEISKVELLTKQKIDLKQKITNLLIENERHKEQMQLAFESSLVEKQIMEELNLRIQHLINYKNQLDNEIELSMRKNFQLEQAKKELTENVNELTHTHLKLSNLQIIYNNQEKKLRELDEKKVEAFLTDEDIIEIEKEVQEEFLIIKEELDHVYQKKIEELNECKVKLSKGVPEGYLFEVKNEIEELRKSIESTKKELDILREEKLGEKPDEKIEEKKPSKPNVTKNERGFFKEQRTKNLATKKRLFSENVKKGAMSNKKESVKKLVSFKPNTWANDDWLFDDLNEL